MTTTITDRFTVTSSARGKRMLDTSPRSMDWETSSYISTITWVTVRKAAAAENHPAASPAKNRPMDWWEEM